MKFLSAILAAMLLLSAAAKAETTNALSDSEIQGRKLARQLCEARPAENFTNTGVLKIRDAKKNWQEVPVRFQIAVVEAEPSSWEACYETTGTNHLQLTISHSANRSNRYRLLTNGESASLTGSETDVPFAGSDFWVGDFGLEFLFWPDQKILKKEFHDNCASIVLESRNPHPSDKGYSRVVSRIEEESGGVMEASTYDVSGRLLKDFRVKNMKKVNGRWQVELVIMDNVQTRTRTQLEFDLKK